MKITTFTVNPFSQNTYLLTSGTSALLFDAGFYSASEFSMLSEALKSESAELSAIVLTHAHIDHIMGVEYLKNKFDVPVYLHPDDQYLWENYMAHAAMFGFDVKPFGFQPEELLENNELEINGFRMKALHTPGHAPGHLSFYFEQDNVLIAGDTLFQGSIGRTDLYKGSFEILEKSIREKLYTLPDVTRVLPGHGPETTIGFEKRNNPFVRM